MIRIWRLAQRLKRMVVRWAPTIFVVLVLLFVVVGISVVTSLLQQGSITANNKHQLEIQRQTLRDSNRKQLAEAKLVLYNAQVAACYRQNIRQRSQNRNAKAAYDLNKLFADLITRPQPGRPLPTKQEQQQINRFHGRLEGVVGTLAWIPVVSNCRTDPTAVKLPILFAVQQPSQFDLGKSPAKRHKHHRL